MTMVRNNYSIYKVFAALMIGFSRFAVSVRERVCELLSVLRRTGGFCWFRIGMLLKNREPVHSPRVH